MENNHRLMHYVSADKIPQDLLNRMTNLSWCEMMRFIYLFAKQESLQEEWLA